MITKLKKSAQLIGIITIGILMVATVVSFAQKSADRVLANGPIPPGEGGHPKLSLSTKVVTPTLADVGNAVLTYNLEIINTGAYTASSVSLFDEIPNHTTYNNDVESSATTPPVYEDGVLLWAGGEVGFDASVEITFSVTISQGYEGIISNTAIISDPMIDEPVIVTAETRVTDQPLFEITKTSTPALPGKNKPLVYELVVTNQGQQAINTDVIVRDTVPLSTTLDKVGPGGVPSPDGDVVTWTRSVNLDFGDTTTFTFSVNIGDVPSGTVIQNLDYGVVSPNVDPGEPYTTTVIDPILILSKSVYPDPPGANREMTYTLTVLNLGSQATNVVITDTIPANVEYVRGGDPSPDFKTVSWLIPSLNTRESAQVTYTVYIGDIAGPDYLIENSEYIVCSAEEVCSPGIPVTSLIVGPIFEVTAAWDPIAHKPGGGDETMVTPTVTILNTGPGNAISSTALLTFGNVSIVKFDDLEVIPSEGTPPGVLSTGPECFTWPKCENYLWRGDLDVGDMITITTNVGQSTIGGAEWTPYTATVVITDELGAYVTPPVSATAIGHVTHHANLIPIKSAPPEIGPGQVMTYTIEVFNSGLSTDEFAGFGVPILTETVPVSLTLLRASDGGDWDPHATPPVITWELEPMGPGDSLTRTFTVETDPGLVSGTLIINDDYRTTWFENAITGTLSIVGEPVTTTIHEVGLIDSYKTVSPTWALPGTGIVLTWTVHVVNSGPTDLTGVHVDDVFPWEHSTYQRDAVASSGSLASDIVSLEWTGDVAHNSEQLITFTTKVDDFFEGVLTNTAIITDNSLKLPVEVSAEAYITNKPVLRISKTATPDPVMGGGTLLYHISVTNLGQQATLLTITDTIPANTTYVPWTASSGGQVVDNVVQWVFPVLNHGETLDLTFQVVVNSGKFVINDHYAVRCDEGVSAFGEPVITPVFYNLRDVFLPLTIKN